MPSSRAVAVALGLAAVAAAQVSACTQSTGVPAAPAALESLTYDAGTTPAEAAPPAPPLVWLVGNVGTAHEDGGVAGALVVAEVGGLGPDGGDATLSVNGAIRYGAATGATGGFAFRLPAGAVGLCVLDKNDLEARVVVEARADAGRSDAAHEDGGPSGPTVTLAPLALAGDAGLPHDDAGAVLRPRVKRLTISSAVGPVFVTTAPPNGPVAFAAEVTSAVGDPLSGDVILVQPTTGWAGALTPPSPAVPGGPYPDGVYARVVEAPALPGSYTYTLVAASTHGVTSDPATVVLTVVLPGGVGIPEAGLFDAGAPGDAKAARD